MVLAHRAEHEPSLQFGNEWQAPLPDAAEMLLKYKQSLLFTVANEVMEEACFL